MNNEETKPWQLELRKMRKEDSFDDKFDTKTLEFIYAFQMGYISGAMAQDKHIEWFSEWLANNDYEIDNEGIWHKHTISFTGFHSIKEKNEAPFTTYELKETYFKQIDNQ